MAGRLTIWGAQQLLTSYFTASAKVPPTFYLALVRTVPPTPYMSGSELDEPDASDYVRAQIDNIPMNWMNDAQPQEVYNIVDISFVSAANDWGQVGYWALCDAPIAGNNLIVGQLEQPLIVMTDDQVVFQAGDLSVSLGPFFLIDEA